MFRGKNCTSWISFFLSLIAGITALYVLSTHNLVLSMGDGKSHLDVARRVFDSLTPSMAQLGGIWLPLPHILMFPFIWNDYLWHTGLAGTIPSVIAFSLCGLSLFLLTKSFYSSKLALTFASPLRSASPLRLRRGDKRMRLNQLLQGSSFS